MCRKMLLTLVGMILTTSTVLAQTIIPGGDVSGTWEISGSPYLIEGEITVPSGDTLIIEPGVEVNFQGHYKLIVNGFIESVGTQSDSILFTAVDADTGWHGIRFVDAPDSSHLAFCIIQYGRATGSSPDFKGGGVYCDSSNPVISHCTIRENSAAAGGGIYCDNNSSPSISHCTIGENLSVGSDGGGINCWEESSPNISHCIISGNSTDNYGGGIFCGSSSDPSISHCTISGNSSGLNGGGINCYLANPSIVNTIVEGNLGSGGINLYSSGDLSVTYSDIYNNEGGNFTGNTIPPGLGQTTTVNANGDSCDIFHNIFEDPLFEDPINGNFQITWASFPTWDETRSPCIDAGDPDPLNYDPDSTVADIGAFYFDQSAFPPEPEIEVSTSMLDFDSVRIGNQANLPLTIYNQGNRALVLYDIYTNEPSFTTDFDPADSLIVPRDSLLITVTFSPAETISYNETLTIENNDELAEVALLGAGMPLLEPNIVVSADSLDFGSVTIGNQSNLPLTLYNLGDTTLVLYDIHTSEPSFTTDFDPADSLIVPGDSLLITVTFSPAETISYNETLTIENNDELTEVSLLGIGIPLPEPIIVVSEDSLDFGSVMIGNQSDLPLTLYNIGDTTLVLYDIHTSEPSFTTDFDPADSLIVPGDSLLITVTFSPTEVISYNDTMTIENNDELVEVALLGVGIPLPEPIIVVSEDSLEFGPVMINSQSDLPLIIYNAGDTTLVLYDIHTSEPSFSTDFNPADSLIGPGDFLLIMVTFSPAETLSYDEILTIDNNDELTEVALMGVGMPLPEPNIAVSTDSLDFGLVLIGNQSDLPLTIYNVGDTTLVLYDIYTSDSSFTTNFDPADSLIAVGDSLILTVTFSPPADTVYSDTLTIESNDELVEVALLGVGTPIPQPNISISADSLDFGSVMVGNQADLPLTIYNTGDTTLVLYDIYTSDSSFTTDFDPADSLIAVGDSLILTVTFLPAADTVYSDTLAIENNDELAEVALLGVGTPIPQPNISISADSLDFGSVMVGNQADLPLTIYNVGDTTLILYDITASDSSFTTDFDPADSLIAVGDSLILTVTFSPAADTVYSDTLTIENNDELAEVALVGVGTPIPQPNISVSEDSLEFGSVMVGNQADLPLTIYNVGDTTLVLYDITASDSSFTTDFDPADSLITPGDSLMITVTFSPAVIASYGETLTIENNDELEIVLLQGNGIGPVAVTLTPYNPPIVIPESGGSFDFNIAVENLTPEPQTFDLWSVIRLPEVGEVPIIVATDLTIPGNTTVDRDRTQQVPDFAPAGIYTYFAYVGTYPWVVDHYDSFTFEKEGSDRGGSLGSPSDWLCSGEPFPGEPAISNIPETFAVSAPYPNPFNPVTFFTLALPEAAYVHLTVYDISGRLVVTIINGRREAGYHHATLDGSTLASGVYIYSLQAGGFTACGKMVLIK